MGGTFFCSPSVRQQAARIDGEGETRPKAPPSSPAATLPPNGLRPRGEREEPVSSRRDPRRRDPSVSSPREPKASVGGGDRQPSGLLAGKTRAEGALTRIRIRVEFGGASYGGTQFYLLRAVLRELLLAVALLSMFRWGSHGCRQH